MKHTLILLFLPLIVGLLACEEPVDNAWFNPNPSSWPQIAMINEVWYQNGERYIHESFDYAATGFLFQYQGKTYAATAKHVLWIAKPEGMQTVNPNPNLKRWIMHPKGNLSDSVVIDSLINTDTTELLEGPASSIGQRDWIVFSTKKVSRNIQPLLPSFRQLKAGEKLYYTGCPYQDSTCVVGSGKVLRVRGSRIEFSIDDPNAHVNGASGSPLLDSAGYVVGILAGTSVHASSNDPAFYGISTDYLEKILKDDPQKNQALVSIADVLREELTEGGVEAAIEKYETIASNERNYFIYSVSPEEFLSVANELLANEQIEDAIRILKLALKSDFYFSRTHSLLGKAYAQLGEITSAKNELNIALEQWPENEEAGDLLLELESN